MRYRNIHCKIWNDDKFPFASDECQLLIFHVLTTPLSTPYGLYKASIAALASEKRWKLAKYQKAFREALRIGFLKYDEKHQLIFIPNFLNYNPPQSPNVLKSWRSSYHELPDSPLKGEFYQTLKALAEGYGEGYREVFTKAFPEVSRKTPATATATAPDSLLLEEEIKGVRFQPPTLEEVRNYCKERTNGVDPETWYDHYTSNGWKVGKNKMVDWQAAVRTWEKDKGGKKYI